MLALAADTSGKQGSITLARGDAHQFELVATAPVRGGTFSAQLIPQIAALLAEHKLKKQDIYALCAASGPGSFTGLRVGLAAIKGLAETLHKPIAAVSVLQALAAQAPQDDKPILAVLDAGRGDVYVGEYRHAEPLPALIEEKIVSLEKVSSAYGNVTVVASDDSVTEHLRQVGGSVIKVEYPGSAAIARLGIHKLLLGEVTPVEALDANYIRRSDAELFSLPKIMGRADQC